MAAVFTKIVRVHVPEALSCGASGKNPAFSFTFDADGTIPFPQVVIHAQGRQHLIKDDAIQMVSESADRVSYEAKVPASLTGSGEITLQVEGCKRADFANAGGGDWVKEFIKLTLAAGSSPQSRVSVVSGPDGANAVKVYFGIHKHMHQPYYNTTDPRFWDGEKDGIFSARGGPYSYFIPAAVQQYIEGDLAHGGLSTSWSGSLIEQLNRCAAEGLCHGRFAGWNQALQEIAQAKTALGNPRVDFTAFGFFHPLMPLIPARNIVKQINWHRRIVRDSFDAEAANILFPPETAFHVRMIPALKEAGIEVVIYDSIHRYRACRDYPYAGMNEGMLPPNPAEQVNPAVTDWFQLHNIWAGSKIAPSLLRPEYIEYMDPEGVSYKIIGVPAERYIGNEDARGGFGALQYPDVLGQVYDQIVATGSFDPQHPPFFLLHSDGDNHGGGADSYYLHNTGQLVNWIQGDPRFELTTISDYLHRFPPDMGQPVHVEPGAWSGADNGDPQFMKWFSRYHESYSPDLNSWAVLTAFQNMVHSLEDAQVQGQVMDAITRLMLTAETSCYWYWTGQTVWDQQVTNAANLAYGRAKAEVDKLLATGRDRTGPTIFAPWIIPENPGGKRWGQGCLKDAPREGVVHTFIHDISGVKRVTLTLRAETGEKILEMENHGPYPSQTDAAITANYYTVKLPVGIGDVRYHIEAEDERGNIAHSALERIYLA